MQTSTLSGLGPGTMLMTQDGEVPVEWLAPGDRVLTRDLGAIPVAGVIRTKHQMPEGGALPHPVILLPADCPTAVMPWEKLRLAPDHRVLLRLPELELNFAKREVLASIVNLSRRTRLREDPDMGELTYHHVLMPEHALIMAGGLWVESTCPAMAARLPVPPNLRDLPLLAPNARTVRMCLTAQEAQMIRQITPPEKSLLDLLAA